MLFGTKRADMFKAMQTQGIATLHQVVDEAEERKDLLVNGQDATAIVLEMSDTGQTVNYNPLVELKMRITSADGNTYEQTQSTIFSALSRKP